MIARLGGVPLTLCFLFWQGVEDAFLMDCASHAFDKWLTRLVLDWALRVLGWTGAAPASGLKKQCRSLGVPTWAWEIDLVLCWTVVALNRCCYSMHVKLAWLYELVPTGHSALATHGKRAEGIKQMEKKAAKIKQQKGSIMLNKYVNMIIMTELLKVANVQSQIISIG